MNYLERLQSMALFMIFLMIMLPISSSYVYAQAMNPVTTYAKNSDGITRYRAEDDKTTVYAEINESGVTASNVFLKTKSTLPFTKCVFQQGKSICTYEYTAGLWAPKTYE
ncbi:MAG TPA: hypothetical protein VKE88_02575, partial [Candidatus Nanoarchaeia archaeon]|nr:hypothetical protein [Candidatus Nanoarchaeia archaeon]